MLYGVLRAADTRYVLYYYRFGLCYHSPVFVSLFINHGLVNYLHNYQVVYYYEQNSNRAFRAEPWVKKALSDLKPKVESINDVLIVNHVVMCDKIISRTQQ